MFIIAGLIFIPQLMIKGFVLFGKGIVVLITISLAFSIIETLTGFTVIPGMLPLSEGVYIVGVIAITLAGAFPLVHFLKKVLSRVLSPLGDRLNMNENALIGLVSSLAHSIPMFKMLHTMDEKGKLVNIAFAVSGAFVLGGHLGFTASVEAEMLIPMMAGKIIAGAADRRRYILCRRQVKENSLIGEPLSYNVKKLWPSQGDGHNFLYRIIIHFQFL